MRRLAVFENISLDGCFCGPGGDLSWAKGHADEEFDAFTASNAEAGGALLLGRITFEMMAGFWPTPMAAEQAPIVAERMNAMPKYVASRTLAEPGWSNATVLEGDLAGAVAALKAGDGPDITILGSGSIVQALAGSGLIDEYRMVVNPLLLSGGRPLFEGLSASLPLRRTDERSFGNGNVFLRYEPAR